jgi:hypothetical protein
MTGPLIPLPLPDLTWLVQPVAAVFSAYGAAKIGPPLVRNARQRAYDEASAAEVVALVISPPVGLTPDPELSVELIRALHPRQRRGFDAWRVGWPSIELRLVHRDDEVRWEIVTNRQVAALAENALRTLCPGTVVDVGKPVARPASAVAVARLASSSTWPLREAERPEARVLHRLIGALEAAPRGVEVRLGVLTRPIPPEEWRKATEPAQPNSSPSIGQIIGAAIIDGLFFHKSRFDDRSTSAASTLSPDDRDAQSRKRRGVVGFDVGLVLEVAGLPADQAEALLWRLVDFTHPLSDGHQEVRWKIQRGGRQSATRPPRRLGARATLVSARRILSTGPASFVTVRSPRRHLQSVRANSASLWRSRAVDRWRSRSRFFRAMSSRSGRPARARARSCSISRWPRSRPTSAPRSSTRTATWSRTSCAGSLARRSAGSTSAAR